MHLPAVQHQFSRGADTDVSCHSLSLSFLAVYCLPLWVTVMIQSRVPVAAQPCDNFIYIKPFKNVFDVTSGLSPVYVVIKIDFLKERFPFNFRDKV